MTNVEIPKLVVALVAIVLSVLLIALASTRVESTQSSIDAVSGAQADDERDTNAVSALLKTSKSTLQSWWWLWVATIVLGVFWLLAAISLAIRSFGVGWAQKLQIARTAQRAADLM